ncbi:gamma-tubulin NDAI_0D00710 [Naumovozyma dairenensis CBS 421]|uniref:Tubulin gamma chain n=1 Tax=Naumovozyma dairenensis (strain ATCC 10597 / BCRC 20456 / CBS 421 / NBRC 0211 / NRRL Y-12639) TaxID=1071378 RepID=G0W9C4_NAUDC|nr:hypothetical protein NDAI_0D00710 [Naumovozyma dairenensis CBS 421]CCD24385.1 hypothetical protein NDAI_0D00710 [Naumovozyma dairenensis CBS 421]
MTGEIITLQIGQCGNHVGKQFWSQLADEHGLNRSGESTQATTNTTDNNAKTNIARDDFTTPFFKENNNSTRYTPRAIMIDMEPSAIFDVQNHFPGFFDDRNTWISQGELGAGNTWAKGYDCGTTNEDTFLNMIDKEIDSTENFEGFQIIHSVAGGTGSGLGSSLLEAISERYPKKFLSTYSVFPGKESEVVVQPYNTILTLRRLAENSDAAIIFDNNALLDLTGKVFRDPKTDYDHTNQLIAATMSSITNSIRFPSYMYCSMPSIFSTLVPSPDLQFLSPSFTPFTSDYVTQTQTHHNTYKRNNTAYDVLLDLLDPSNSLISSHVNNPTYFNVFNTIIGNVDRNDITRAIGKIQQRINFAPWASNIVHVNVGRRSPYLIEKKTNNTCTNEINGMMLASSTQILSVLDRACKTFDKIFAKKAFLKTFEDGNLFKNGQDEFIASREVVQNVIDEYLAATGEDYLDEVLIPDENMFGDYNDTVGHKNIDDEGDNIM